MGKGLPDERGRGAVVAPTTSEEPQPILVYRVIRGATPIREDLEVVKSACERDGEATLDGLALIEARPDGDRRLIAQERDLAPMVGFKLGAGVHA